MPGCDSGDTSSNLVMHFARLGKLVNPPGLEPGHSRFESETGQFTRKSVNGKPASSKLATRGSSPRLRECQHSNDGSRARLKNEISQFDPECWHLTYLLSFLEL